MRPPSIKPMPVTPARRARVSPDWALVPLRLAVGAGFLVHGLAKWGRGPEGFARLLARIDVPFPMATAWAVTLLEVFGGIALIVGVCVALFSVPLIATMLAAMFTVHWPYGFSSVNTIGLTATGPVFGPPGYELNLVYVGSLVALAFLGPGRWSLSGMLAKRRSRAATEPRA